MLIVADSLLELLSVGEINQGPKFPILQKNSSRLDSVSEICVRKHKRYRKICTSQLPGGSFGVYRHNPAEIVVCGGLAGQGQGPYT